MENKLLYDFLKIGLTQGEAKVYMALTVLGSSTIGPIISKAQIASSNVYDILNRLLEKGIISYIMKNKVHHYQAASPQTLLEFLNKKEAEIKEQKESLKKIIPELKRMQQFNPHQKAEMFFGQRGLRAAYEKHLIKKSRQTENLFLYVHKKRYAEKSDRVYFSLLDLYLRVPQRGITNEYARTSQFFQQVTQIKTRYADFPIPGQVEICNDSVLLVSWEETIITILIQSGDIAENIRTYFKEVWKLAKE